MVELDYYADDPKAATETSWAYLQKLLGQAATAAQGGHNAYDQCYQRRPNRRRLNGQGPPPGLRGDAHVLLPCSRTDRLLYNKVTRT